MTDGPIAIGDEQFLRKLSGEPEAIPEGIEQITITSDAEGNIIGDHSHIDPHILAQLQMPEWKAKIAAMHEDYHRGGGELPKPKVREPKPKREPRYLNEGTRRDFTHLRPAGMDKKEFKTLRKQQFHRMRKAALKFQRSLHHGN